MHHSSKTAYESLLGLVLNPEYGDITDPESGTDLVLTYGKPAGASFPQTKLTPRRRSSVLCDDAVGGDDDGEVHVRHNTRRERALTRVGGGAKREKRASSCAGGM